MTLQAIRVLAEVVGFEPTHQLITDLTVFKAALLNLLSILPYKSSLSYYLLPNAARCILTYAQYLGIENL